MVLKHGFAAAAQWPNCLMPVTTSEGTKVRQVQILAPNVQFNVLSFPSFQRKERIKVNCKFRKHTKCGNF